MPFASVGAKQTIGVSPAPAEGMSELEEELPCPKEIVQTAIS